MFVAGNIKIPLREFSFTFVRSSGPGGQNVNKVASKAVLRWQVRDSPSLRKSIRERFLAKYHRRINEDGEIIIMSGCYRDQGRNVANCMERLREMLMAVATPPKKRVPTKPSKAAIKARLESKKRRSEKKRRRSKVDTG